MRVITFIMFALFCSGAVFAQNQREIDELEQTLRGAKEDSNKVINLNRLAFEYRLSDVSKGLTLINQSIQLAEKLNYQLGLASAYNNQGILYKNQFLFSDALKAYGKSLRIFGKLKDSLGLANAYNNMGTVYKMQTNYEQAMNYYLKALKLREQIRDTEGAAAAYNNVSGIYMSKNMYNEAIRYNNISLAMYKQLGDSFSIGRVGMMQADYFYQADMYDSALAYCRRILPIFKDAGDVVLTSTAYNTIGNVLVEQNNIDEGIKNHQMALDLQIQAKDSNNMFLSLLSLGQAYGFKHDFTNGLRYANDALNLLNTAGGVLKYYMDTYLVLAELYRKSGKYKQATDAFVTYYQLRDSFLQEESNAAILDVQTRYETEKKNLMLAKQQTELQKAEYQLQRRRWTITALVALLLGVLAVSYLLYNRYKLKKRQELDATIIYQQQLRSKAVIEAEENERVRIAQDLHDGVGQQLAAVKINLIGFGDIIEDQPDMQKEKLGMLVNMVDDAVKEVRAVSHSMTPNALVRSGLVAAIREFIYQVSSSGKLKVDLELVGFDARLDNMVETVLYRIMQECMNNIIKHAGASTVSIQLVRYEAYVNMIVEDNGKGFDPKQQKDGLGLHSMASRVAYLNGTIDIDSTPGRGTTVIVDVPLVHNN